MKISIKPNDGYFTFSGGEVHLKSSATVHSHVHIQCTDYTMNGFMAIAQHVEVLRRHEVGRIDLGYPYLPYARQDRVMARDEPFSLQVFCKLINSLELDGVVVWDPHSDVGPALINNCRVINQWDIAPAIIPAGLFTADDVMWVSPDAGAYKKLSKLIPDDNKICIAVKKRDVTGQVVSTKVMSETSLEGKHCVIVDDICDGGRTFIALGNELKRQGARWVDLYVTHGIFSKGFSVLEKSIDRIFTTNSFHHVHPPVNVTVKDIL